MSKRKVLVLGFYHRHNLGDNVFQYVLENFFKKQWKNLIYDFICIDDLVEIPQDTSCVIVGGGDLVNDYFFHKLKPYLNNKTCPWYAISIGIPYPDLIHRGYLDSFDYIIHRNQEDKLILEKRYPDITSWFPDMAFLLTNNERSYFNSKKKKIGIFLSRHIYNDKNPEIYKNIVLNLSKFFSNISTIRNCFGRPIYELYLIPFCTDGKISNDDTLINQDVYNKLKHLDNVHLFESKINMNDIIPIFNSFHMTICSRFHSHIFSLISKVPILSIYTTRKVQNFLDELGVTEFSYKMKTDEQEFPVELDDEVLLEKFNSIENNYNNYLIKINNLHELYRNKISEFKTVLNNLLFYLPRQDLDVMKYANEIATKLHTMKINMLGVNLDNRSVYDMLSRSNNKLVKVFKLEHKKRKRRSNQYIINELIGKNGSINRHFKRFSDFTKNNIIELISYILTGERKSIYHYGLSQQVFTSDYNLYESCKWILNHIQSNNIDLNNKMGIYQRKLKFNINSKLFSGYHRSGWSYVLNSLKDLYNPEGVIFDSYLDKTFGWEYEFLSLTGIIPYTKPWIGVFHHTPDQNYSMNNLTNLFATKNFQESLKYCKGVIVLSESNREFVQSRLKDIHVLKLYHPTEFPDKLFDFNIFQKNKGIVQIGAWLRNTYAIYELNVPEEYHKLVLKGKDMGNYFLSKSDIDNIINMIKTVGAGDHDTNRISGGKEECRISGGNHNKNKYSLGLANLIKQNHDSVTLLEGLNNTQYDHLLTQNIVFINLVDAAAVNTILECIARNTPILVNRLPATEEYLGRDYPLFYDSYEHAYELLSNDKNIKNGYKYLIKMDKSRFTINYFINNLISSELYRKL